MKLRICSSIATVGVPLNRPALRGGRIRLIRWLPTTKIPSLAGAICCAGRKPLAVISPPFHQRCLSTAPQTTAGDDFAEEGINPLTRTMVRRMKVAQLREELSNRGLDPEGTRPKLLERLLEALDNNCGRSEKKEETTTATTTATYNNMLIYCADDVLTNGEISTPTKEEEMGFLTDTNAPPLDPERIYLVRVRSAPSGKGRLVDGIGIGMTILEVNNNNNNPNSHPPNNNNNPYTVLQNNQLLLPGKRNPLEADYCALIMAMRYTKSRGVQHLILETDEPTIIQQVSGEGEGIRPGYYLQELHLKAMQLKGSFNSFEIRQYRDDVSKEKEREFRHPPPLPTEKPPPTRTASSANQRHLESEKEIFNPMISQSTVHTEATPTTTATSVPISPNKQYLLQFDGGARGNPVGVAGAGMVLLGYDKGEEEEEIWCGWKYLGEGQTNNQAEYQSLIEGLENAQKIGIKRIRAEGDSELVVKQVLGIYKVRKEWLKPLHRRVKELSTGFESFEIASIPRDMNKRADWLANHAMDIQTSGSNMT